MKNKKRISNNNKVENIFRLYNVALSNKNLSVEQSGRLLIKAYKKVYLNPARVL